MKSWLRPRKNVGIRISIVICLGVLSHVTALLAAEAPDIDALKSALASQTAPRLEWQTGAQPTISVTQDSASVQISGLCHNERPVVISGRGIAEPARVDCVAGGYVMRADSAALNLLQEIVATQVLLDGRVVAARNLPPSNSGREIRSGPTELRAAFASARPGDRILLEPGTYADVAINLPAGKGGKPGRPVAIDGDNAVTFTGSTRISVMSGHVVLQRLVFREVGPGAVIAITGPDVRITESRFIDCGDPRRPQAECLIVTTGGAGAELDFNTFAGSRSMSVKVRAGPDGSANQPADVSIHHNVFRDIRRASDNGQEPIQIAGPNGGASETALKTRIEHNLFYRADGDREAVSMKGPGTLLRWNAFRDMDAAPNLRGSHDSTIAENILIRTRPIRIAGKNHRVVGNILLCPKNKGSGFLLSHGSPGYGVAVDNVIRDNIVATARTGIAFAAQTQPVGVAAHGNRIAANSFYLPKTRSAFKVLPDSLADEVMAANTLVDSEFGAKLCH